MQGTSGAQGGNGGNITLTAADKVEARDIVLFSMDSNPVAAGNGQRGLVTLNAHTINADNILVYDISPSSQTSVFINADTLEVKENQSTTLQLNNPDPESIRLNTIDLGQGSTLKVTRNSTGGFYFDTLRVSGTGATYQGDGIELDASGKTLVFDLPSSVMDGDTMLFAQDAVKVDDATVHLASSRELPSLEEGHQITLIDHTLGTIANAGEQTLLYGATQYQFNISDAAGALTAQYTGRLDPITGQTDFSKAYAEGLMAATMALNSGTDVITGMVLNQAEQAGSSGQHIFVDTQANHIKGRTGSHVTSDGYHIVGGAAFSLDTAAGAVTIAPVIEYGKGNYNSYNSFESVHVKGSGNTHYWGGGLIGRIRFDNNMYTEGSFRAGRVKTDFQTSDLGADARYDSTSRYYGAHVGVGYLVQINNKDQLDVYTKLLWTHQQGDAVMTEAMERFDFDSIDSLRTRLGGRYTFNMQSNFQLYTGVAWDYEATARASARLNGQAIYSEPSLRGSTGIAEVGVNWQPVNNLDIHFGLQGLAGKREGASGSVSLRYAF